MRVAFEQDIAEGEKGRGTVHGVVLNLVVSGVCFFGGVWFEVWGSLSLSLSFWKGFKMFEVSF